MGDIKLTREQKRRKQKLEADVKAVAWIIVIAGLGAAAALLCMSVMGAEDTARELREEREQTVNAGETLIAWTETPVQLMAAAREQDPEPEPAPARYPLTDSERDIVERVVMAEAGNESFNGKCLVAQCILNTCEARGMTPAETVTEKNQYTAPAAEASDSVKQAVAAVFDDGYTVTDEPVRWFYAPKYAKGRWHESKLTFVLEYGGHRFFKE